MVPPIQMNPIGWVSSVFKEKFGTPRQSGVVPAAEGTIFFHPPYDTAEAFQELEGFSHLWIISQFHLIPEEEFRPKVRPPKLGGKKRVGVFASRAPYRPNRLCLSVVKLEEIKEEQQKVSLRISGLDLVDQTPVLDVKPYLPYADSHPLATTAFGLPPSSTIEVIPEEEKVYDGLTQKDIALITQVLQAQPQPAYSNPDQCFGLSLREFNIQYRTTAERIVITKIEKNH